MTRPREHLIISCAPTARRSSGSFSSMLGEALGTDINDLLESQVLTVGEGKLDVEVTTETLGAPGRVENITKQAGEKRDWRAYVDLWSRRRDNFETAAKSPLFLTPTLLKRREEESSEAAEQSQRTPAAQTPAMLVGDLAHRFLQTWDFASAPGAWKNELKSFIGRCLAHEYRQETVPIQNELEAIFVSFFGSEAYLELAAARILGREVPLLVPWNGQIMEGVIDVIYERNGLLYLADYKTDKVSRDDLAGHGMRYYQQAEIYTRATQQSLGKSVAAFKLLFLRLGEAVEVRLLQKQGELFG